MISVAEVWLPPPPAGMTMKQYTQDLQSHPQPFKAWQEHAAEVAEAEALAGSAANRLQAMFPKWKVSSEGTYGSPGWEVLDSAAQRKADLIVVGSHGRSALGRLWMGSISQKVLTEAECSVRVARGKVEVDPSPVRIVIGYDGTIGSGAAVESVASRVWPAGSEVKLVSVCDIPHAWGVDPPSPSVNLITRERGWMLSLTTDAIIRLRGVGLKVECVSEEGNPKSVLVEVAQEWGADCIFVGANRFGSRLERFLLGSVSAAVAARAHCSVEAVRSA